MELFPTTTISGMKVMKLAHDAWTVDLGTIANLVFVVLLDGKLTTARGPYPAVVNDLALHAVRKSDPAAR